MDLWGDQVLSQRFPELFSFAKNKQLTLVIGRTQNPLHSLFYLPLSQQAHSQMLHLEEILSQEHFSQEKDKWTYIWNSGKFLVKKTYKHLNGHQSIHPVYKWLWASSCQAKHKVFFWLLLKDRLSTRDLLQRKNMHLQSANCVLCNSAVQETLVHLFLECPFAIQCWGSVQVQIDLTLDHYQNLQSFRDQLRVPFFMEIIILMAWAIWKARNDLIFRQINPSLQSCTQFFKSEMKLLLLRAKRSYSPAIDLWIAEL